MTNRTYIKRSVIAVLINGLLFSNLALAAPPGKPSLGSNLTFSPVMVDRDAVAYEKLFKGTGDGNIQVKWDIWSGDVGQTARILFDNEVVWTGNAANKSAAFKFDKGGKYTMIVEIENKDGVTRSDPVSVSIGSTDGAHLPPLKHQWTENNKPYTNTSGKIVGTYFVEWGIYGRAYPLTKAPLSNLNRLIYGFIPICGGDGINDSLKTISGSFESLMKACEGRADFKVAIHDPWAAVNVDLSDYPLPYDAPVRGNYAMLMAAKQAHPDLVILPSIGGWTLSDPFFFMDDAAKRKTFIDSVREFLITWKFWDGVDVDFEFPGGGGANPNLGNKNTDGEIYITILRELREMLDELGRENGRYYQLTSAISVGSDKIKVIDYGRAQQYLDNIYLMSYDFYGAWSNTELNHQTALHASSVNTEENEYYTSRGVDLLIAQGVPANKLVVGAAAYGRGWTGVKGIKDGNPFTGTASGPIKGTWEPGVLDYRDIVKNHTGGDWQDGYDEQAEAPYKFKPSTGELITYDDARSVKAKAQYVMEKGLAGIFHWEMDGDNGDLVNAMHEGLGAGSGGGSEQPTNRPPTANAGLDKSIIGAVEVALDGSKSSDPEGSELKYEWTQTAGTSVQISNGKTATASAMIPEVAAETQYTFSLKVTDKEGLSATDTVVVTNKVPSGNDAPTAVLPSTTNVNENAQFTVTVNAQDANGDPLQYRWEIDPVFKMTGGSNGNAVTLQAPAVDADTEYPVSVIVSDGQADVTATAKIKVKNVEQAGGGETGGGSDNGGCSSSDDNAANYPAWDAGTVYTNETVSHNGLVYQAKWWVQGSEPTPSNEAWALMSTVELPWDPSVAYQGNKQVNHNGSRWQAQWWTQGGEPGVDSVWVNVGPATCN